MNYCYFYHNPSILGPILCSGTWELKSQQVLLWLWSIPSTELYLTDRTCREKSLIHNGVKILSIKVKGFLPSPVTWVWTLWPTWWKENRFSKVVLWFSHVPPCHISKYINRYTGIIQVLILKATHRLHFFFRRPLNCYMLFLPWSSSPLLVSMCYLIVKSCLQSICVSSRTDLLIHVFHFLTHCLYPYTIQAAMVHFLFRDRGIYNV